MIVWCGDKTPHGQHLGVPEKAEDRVIQCFGWPEEGQMMTVDQYIGWVTRQQNLNEVREALGVLFRSSELGHACFVQQHKQTIERLARQQPTDSALPLPGKWKKT